MATITTSTQKPRRKLNRTAPQPMWLEPCLMLDGAAVDIVHHWLADRDITVAERTAREN